MGFSLLPPFVVADFSPRRERAINCAITVVNVNVEINGKITIVKTRNVAIAILIDDDLNILVQERGKHSKVGEKYGFWGGQIEKGETAEQAVRRELLEELGFVPEKLAYLGKFSYVVQEEGKYKDWLINFHAFLSPIISELEKATVSEGKSIVKMSFDEVAEGEGFPTGSTGFLKSLEGKLRDWVLHSKNPS